MSKTLKCTINGVALEVAEGTTIIEAMNRNQQAIAHYCWHPGLSVAGVCRLCMVEIQGNPRLQIACNTVVTDGMVVNNVSDKVKESVKWGLDFHLINHPLDCPICDQAGECGLQDQYMQYGKYDPEMGERKVKKHKVVDLGPRVVLDSERCILCSRCVRFTDEVSKTHELGIFNRGDHSEIGTFDGRPLDNNYSLNTVDICPVGALTSKDFRFRQRVWFLKDFDSVCTGCSTGCAIKLFYNKEGLFRAKPVYDPEVNGHWMCDEGRDVYKFVNKNYRQLDGRVSRGGNVEHTTPEQAARKAGDLLRGQGKAAALVVTGQYTNEELEALVAYWKNEFGSDRVFHWINDPENLEALDGLLNRGDKNPNTRGARETLAKHGATAAWSELESGLASGTIKAVVVAAPENQRVYRDLTAKVALFAKAPTLIWLAAGLTPEVEALATGDVVQIPMKSYVEKSGTFINFKGLARKIKRSITIVPHSLSLDQVAEFFAGREAKRDALPAQSPAVNPLIAGSGPNTGRVQNEMTRQRGAL